MLLQQDQGAVRALDLALVAAEVGEGAGGEGLAEAVGEARVAV